MGMVHQRVGSISGLIAGLKHAPGPQLVLGEFHLGERELLPDATTQHRADVREEIKRGRIVGIVGGGTAVQARLRSARQFVFNNAPPFHGVTVRAGEVAAIRPGNRRVGPQGCQQRLQPVGIGRGRVLGQKHQIVALRLRRGQIAGFAVAELLGRNPDDPPGVGLKNSQGPVTRAGIHRDHLA